LKAHYFTQDCDPSGYRIEEAGSDLGSSTRPKIIQSTCDRYCMVKAGEHVGRMKDAWDW